MNVTRRSRFLAVIALVGFAAAVFLPLAPLRAQDMSALADKAKDKALEYSKDKLIEKLSATQPELARILGAVDANNWPEIAGMLAGGDYAGAIQKAFDDNQEELRKLLQEKLKATSPKLAAALEAIDPAFWGQMAGYLVEGDYSTAGKMVGDKVEELAKAGSEALVVAMFPPMAAVFTAAKIAHATMLSARDMLDESLLSYAADIEGAYRRGGREGLEFALDFSKGPRYALTNLANKQGVSFDQARANLIAQIEKKVKGEADLKKAQEALERAKRSLNYEMADAMGKARSAVTQEFQGKSGSLAQAVAEIREEQAKKSTAPVSVVVTTPTADEKPYVTVKVVPEEKEKASGGGWSWWSSVKDAYDCTVQVFNDTLQSVSTKVKVIVTAYGYRSEEKEVTVATDNKTVVPVKLEPIKHEVKKLGNPYEEPPPGGPPGMPAEANSEVSAAYSAFTSGAKTYSEYQFAIWEARRLLNVVQAKYYRWSGAEYQRIYQISDDKARSAAYAAHWNRCNAWNAEWSAFTTAHLNMLTKQHDDLRATLGPVQKRLSEIVSEIYAAKKSLSESLSAAGLYWGWWYGSGRDVGYLDPAVAINTTYERAEESLKSVLEQDTLYYLKNSKQTCDYTCQSLEDQIKYAETILEKMGSVLPAVRSARESVNRLAEEHQSLFQANEKLLSAPDINYSSYYSGYSYWYWWYWSWYADSDAWRGYDYTGQWQMSLEQAMETGYGGGRIEDLELNYELQVDINESQRRAWQNWLGVFRNLKSRFDARINELENQARAEAAKYQKMLDKIQDTLKLSQELLEKAGEAAQWNPRAAAAKYNEAMSRSGTPGALQAAAAGLGAYRQAVDAHALSLSSLSNEVNKAMDEWEALKQQIAGFQQSQAYSNTWAAGVAMPNYDYMANWNCDNNLRGAMQSLRNAYKVILNIYPFMTASENSLKEQQTFSADAYAATSRALAACNAAAAAGRAGTYAAMRGALEGFENKVGAPVKAAQQALARVSLPADNCIGLGQKLSAAYQEAQQALNEYRAKAASQPYIDSLLLAAGGARLEDGMQFFDEDLASGNLQLKGSATTGGFPITKVEFSTDGGRTWIPAAGTAGFSFGIPVRGDEKFEVAARAFDETGKAGGVHGPVRISCSRQPVNRGVQEILQKLAEGYQRGSWNDMAKCFDEQEYMGDLRTIEDAVKNETASGPRPNLGITISTVQRRGTQVQGDFTWNKTDGAGKKSNGRATAIVAGGKIVNLYGQLPFTGLSTVQAGNVKNFNITVKNGEGVNIVRGTSAGHHDHSAEFMVFIRDGGAGGEIYCMDSGIVEADDDWERMKQAPATGYGNMLELDRGLCFYVKMKNGHFAKVMVTAVTAGNATFRISYRNDGQRSF